MERPARISHSALVCLHLAMLLSVHMSQRQGPGTSLNLCRRLHPEPIPDYQPHPIPNPKPKPMQGYRGR